MFILLLSRLTGEFAVLRDEEMDVGIQFQLPPGRRPAREAIQQAVQRDLIAVDFVFRWDFGTSDAA